MLKVFKDFFACKIFFDANHHHPENIQRLFHLHYCLRRKSSLSWKYSKNFSPAKLSSTQIIIILKICKIFLACKIVLDTNHHYPEIIKRLFRLQNCLRRKSSFSWKYSKTFSPAKLSSTQITIILKIFKDFFACNIVLSANHHYAESIQRLFRLQNCLRRKSSLSWKYSKNFSPAKLSSTQIIIILKICKIFLACKIVLDTNHHYAESIQRLFRLQNCLRRKSPSSWKYSKTKTFWLQNCLSRIFHLQYCLSRKSSLSWKNSKTFSPSKLSYPQIIIMLKVFKDFFACKIVFDANHHHPENIQRLFHLQYCLWRKSSLSWKIQRIFRLQNCLQTQIIIFLKIFKDFFACKIVLDTNHHYPENIQRLFRLQNCLRRKSSLSWKYSKNFFACNIVLWRKSSLCLEKFKDFFAFKIVSEKLS